MSSRVMGLPSADRAAATVQFSYPVRVTVDPSGETFSRMMQLSSPQVLRKALMLPRFRAVSTVVLPWEIAGRALRMAMSCR